MSLTSSACRNGGINDFHESKVGNILVNRFYLFFLLIHSNCTLFKGKEQVGLNCEKAACHLSAKTQRAVWRLSVSKMIVIINTAYCHGMYVYRYVCMYVYMDEWMMSKFSVTVIKMPWHINLGKNGFITLTVVVNNECKLGQKLKAGMRRNTDYVKCCLLACSSSWLAQM